ncbi:GmrSD restriction endonuclease domain-containing protein [Salinisphaera japonica]|uniref:GmrSD restriction endonucleases N-terminal domain-containing protein n=1 Tax=Salinisphaera japonica YTM-1 TaxID=1209778 RepID=A0A423Q090_9GAMM|nr:DUF262 domain-containing protein [Salinisphaera japonica]ROO31327.1 hypothetical protein SAJA_03230 [Salinisphaera japonica YTM-1]
MTTFDSTKTPLPALLGQITEGKIQLPDFQRGWVWDDDHVRSLLVSIARSFPVGAVMLMETGGEVRFQVRPVEGVNSGAESRDPEKLILDGQQRLTSLTQAVALAAPVDTQTNKGKKIKRHYYLHIPTALDGPERLEEALVAVDEKRQILSNFGRDVELDLSTLEQECRQLYFPCDQILNSDAWEEALQAYAPDQFGMYMRFRREVINAFRYYEVPVIELKKETSKEAVCLVFEKVNTGGVQLSVFELITAGYAAEGYNLRDDWYGSSLRDVDSRRTRLTSDLLLHGVESTEFLQAITLLHTHERKRADIQDGRQGKQIRPVSAKRAAVLDLPLDAYKRWADAVEAGYMRAAHFLRKECFYAAREVPYGTQVVPLAAVMTLLGERWREPRIYAKLAQWYWCGVLGELYGGAVETRVANDVDELMQWFDDDEAVPRTVTDAAFQPERLSSLRTRNSAAYKAINVLVLREGAEDFFWKAGIQELDAQEIALDIHHIFPSHWCETQSIQVKQYDNILNKTPISYKANRKIGGDAPSHYLYKIQNDPQVQMSDAEMDTILASHCVPAARLREDDFHGFIDERRRLLLSLIEKVMGKRIAENDVAA